MRSAIVNSGFEFPARRITVNLAPADLPKEGGRYDLAIALGIVFEEMNVGYLVGWAFSVAASANLPALVMLLFWQRTTKQGVIAAVVMGMVSSLAWILLSQDTFTQVYGLTEGWLTPFSQPGIVTIPLGFLTLVVVSLMTPRHEDAVAA